MRAALCGEPSLQPCFVYGQGRLGLLNPRIRTLDTEMLKADGEAEREQRKHVLNNGNQSQNIKESKAHFQYVPASFVSLKINEHISDPPPCLGPETRRWRPSPGGAYIFNGAVSAGRAWSGRGPRRTGLRAGDAEASGSRAIQKLEERRWELLLLNGWSTGKFWIRGENEQN